MLTVIIGLILFVLCICGAFYWRLVSEWKMSCCIIGVFVIPIATLCIAMSPLYGYEEPCIVNETELVDMLEDDETLIYVYEFSNDVWLYKYVTQGKYVEYDGYYEMDILRSNVKVTELETCNVPILREYKREAKSGLFSFGCASITEYEFVVPVGTCEKTNTVLN